MSFYNSLKTIKLLVILHIGKCRMDYQYQINIKKVLNTSISKSIVEVVYFEKSNRTLLCAYSILNIIYLCLCRASSHIFCCFQST